VRQLGAKRKSFWYQGKHALGLLLVLSMMLAMPPAIPAVADDRPDDACSGVGFLTESQQAAGESQDDPEQKKASGDTLVTASAGETGKDTQEENDEEVTTCDAIEVEIENHAAGNLAVEIEAYLDAMGCPDAYDSIVSLKVSGGELNKADQDYLRQTFWYKCDYLEDVDFSDTSLAYDEGIEMRPGLFESTSFIKIKLPENLTAISDAAFSGSVFLAIVEIPESVTSIGAGAFLGCQCLLAVDLPENINSIGPAAFQYCGIIESIKLPEGIGAIADFTFAHCENLRTINIPESVTSIGKGAFEHCYSLESLDIPESVTFIGEEAFSNCRNLKFVNMLSDIPPQAGDKAFDRVDEKAVVFVPQGKASNYMAANDGNTTDNYWHGLLIDDRTEKRIIRVEPPDDIMVPWKTPREEIGLPRQVEVVLNDGSRLMVDVSWDSGTSYHDNVSPYDGYRTGWFYFTGTLDNLPDNVKNDLGKTAFISVGASEPVRPWISPTVFSFNPNHPRDIAVEIIWNEYVAVANVSYVRNFYEEDAVPFTVLGDQLIIGKEEILSLYPGQSQLYFIIDFDSGYIQTYDYIRVDITGDDYVPGNDASLARLFFGYEAVDGFSPDQYHYDIVVPSGMKFEHIPMSIGPIANDDKARITLSPLTELPGSVVIEVTAEDGMTKRAYTLYFARTTYTVTFNSNGGDTEADPISITVPEGKSIGHLPQPPERPGYTFTGWNTQANGRGTPFTESTPVTSDITVYAQWKANASGGGSSGGGSSGSSSSGGSASSGGGIQTIISDDAASVTFMVPKAAFEKSENGSIGPLTLSSPVASISFDGQALETMVSVTAGDISITASQVSVGDLSQEVRKLIGDRPVFEFRVTSGGKTISRFGGNVTVSVPYTPKPGEDINAIVVYYINAEGKLEVVTDCLYDPATGTIRFTTDHFSRYAVGYNKVTFNDVPATAWYYNAVTFAAAREITAGTGNGQFSPEAKLTRAQFMVLMMKAFGIEPDRDPKDNFADAGSTYYTGYLAAAKRLGITSGIGNNRFGPEQEITRQEAFTMLYKTLKLLGRLPKGSSGKTLASFSDADEIAPWSKEAMAYFVEAGIIAGSGGRLHPNSPITRAEMVQVLYNLQMK